jgi:hypothetical protein
MHGYEDDPGEASALFTLASLAAGAACLAAAAFSSSPIALGILLVGGCAGLLGPAIARPAGECEAGSPPEGPCTAPGEVEPPAPRWPPGDPGPGLPAGRRWADSVLHAVEAGRRSR